MKLCLNMIVKNEAERIERCLASVSPWINSYCIVDTGSTDDTQAKIHSYLSGRGLNGEVYSAPFENFSATRNIALAFARETVDGFDYILLCDADMELRVERFDWLDNLTAPCYRLLQRNPHISYWNARLLKRDAAAHYVGVTHEYLNVEGEIRDLDGAWFWDHADGANRAGKMERDRKLLEDDLVRDPRNGRTLFYLAQTLLDLGMPLMAAQKYAERVAVGGWEEECWYAMLMQSRCLRRIGNESGNVI